MYVSVFLMDSCECVYVMSGTAVRVSSNYGCNSATIGVKGIKKTGHLHTCLRFYPAHMYPTNIHRCY